MKVVGVIPARYNSSRFPGKPLADICGKPMIQWVYQQASQVPEFDELYVATDSIEISSVLSDLKIPFIMTANNHQNHISRIHEVSDIIQADFYVCINGDEPLIDPISIRKVIHSAKMNELPCFYGAMRTLTDPAQNNRCCKNQTGYCCRWALHIYVARPNPPSSRNIVIRVQKIHGHRVL